MTQIKQRGISRRYFVLGAGCAWAGAALPFNGSALAQAGQQAMPQLTGKVFNLEINYKTVNFTGSMRQATVVNNSLPGPALIWQEGETVTLRVTNHLAETSAIHWHGMILPYQMDGVPGMGFAGIPPGGTFEYRFRVQQSGTYWYHSHAGFQEQTGLYGAIIIRPRAQDPIAFDREHVIMLSDWTDESPATLYRQLHRAPEYDSTQERTLVDLVADIKRDGLAATWKKRLMWQRMRMQDRDLQDLTARTYTYLMNGKPPAEGWKGLFKQGERVRLRWINSSAMTLFDVRIPGLRMTLVAADGQPIEPVTVDAFRIGVAETYDVIVEPDSDQAYCLFAQNLDRSGYCRGTLTSDPSLDARIPAMDEPEYLTHTDMGMGGGQANNGHNVQNEHHHHHHHHGQGVKTGNIVNKGGYGLAKAGFGSQAAIVHAKTESGPAVAMQSVSPSSGLDDPGVGLRQHAARYGRKVLRYSDLVALLPTIDRRDPTREIQLHLTGNMHRYLWSIDGKRSADAEPIHLAYGERVRFTLVNDTMMIHPMHLHGLWSELETGHPGNMPKKHTVLVQPGAKISYLVTADALGEWAYHCHLLYHMPGMFRKVVIS